MKVIGAYKNGNYFVTIYDDGTKVRENNLDNLTPDTVESMDIKITNCCDMGCMMCHEDSKPDGSHGDILSHSFIDNLHPYTELAIGGGNPLSHPDLEKFLVKCKNLKLIPSMTVNQTHFMKDYDKIKYLVDNKLIYGLGVSFNNRSEDFIEKVKTIPNAVIHVINGMISVNELDYLAHNNLKVLILGYKEFRRGKVLYDDSNCKSVIDLNKKELHDYLPSVISDSWFNVVSFDNLAIKQLEVKRCLSEDKWNEFYMGDDGNYTFYVDMVNRKFAKSSTSPVEDRYDLIDDPKEMFNIIRNKQSV